MSMAACIMLHIQQVEWIKFVLHEDKKIMCKFKKGKWIFFLLLSVYHYVRTWDRNVMKHGLCIYVWNYYNLDVPAVVV